MSPAEAYKELLRRITVLAWEEMDQPLKDINHKVVVRLVRVLIAARREKHQETRVWVERRKAENWLAREVLREWRRTTKKQAHPSYLPILAERNEIENGGRPRLRSDTVEGGRDARNAHWELIKAANRKASRTPPCFDTRSCPVATLSS